MTPKTRLRVATDPKRGWQANKQCIYATARTIRAMPEKEKPPAVRVDDYYFVKSVYNVCFIFDISRNMSYNVINDLKESEI